MAKEKKTKVLENGLTPKMDIVLKALQGFENGATAAEVFEVESVKEVCETLRSVASSLARLDTHNGMARKELAIVDNTAVSKYVAN